MKIFSTYFPFILLFFMANAAFAQWRMGLHGGGYFSPSGEGVRVSVSASKEIPDRICLFKPELSLVRRPFENQLMGVDPEKSYILTSMLGVELVLPASFQFDFNHWNFFASCGAYMTAAFGNSGYLVKEAGGSSWRKVQLPFSESRLNPFDVGFVWGGGFEKAIANQNRIVLHAYQYVGLKDADKSAASEAFHNNFAVLLGISFPLKNVEKD